MLRDKDRSGFDSHLLFLLTHARDGTRSNTDCSTPLPPAAVIQFHVRATPSPHATRAPAVTLLGDGNPTARYPPQALNTQTSVSSWDAPSRVRR